MTLSGNPADIAKTFRERAYAPLPNLIPPDLRSFLYEYGLKSAQAGSLKLGDPAVPNSPYAYGDPFVDYLLDLLLPRIEEASGLRLFPTYSYFRVYRNGATLARHTDRPACEISLTTNLGYDPPLPWPIFIEAKEGPRAFGLTPGDGLIYRGIDLPHWRERFNGQYAIQVFLHYVDREGPHAEWRYDKRPELTRSPLAARFMAKFKEHL